MNNEKLKIDTSTEKERFSNYLNLIGNERIIFSGIFGSGKTTFLNDYFNRNEKYVAFHIYPTNYSVSKNEDIFELIKFDLIYECLKLEVQLNKTTASITEAIGFVNAEMSILEATELLRPFIEMVPKIGKPVADISKILPDLIKMIREKQKEIETDEGKLLETFIRKIEGTKGSIYERDIFTQLLTDLITRLKDENKTVVLIVDDLDRIDPEHIFRILNIFAVHFNVNHLNESENKFGIDKIILACDIENIRSVFKARYGQDVDFSGYIDKFYTREIYHFDNKKMIVKVIEACLQSVQVHQNDNKVSVFNSENKVHFTLVHYIVTSLILSNQLNLRTLIKVHELQYVIKRYYINVDHVRLKNIQLPLFIVYDFITFLFGSINSTKAKLNQTDFAFPTQKELLFSDTIVNGIYCDLQMIIDSKSHHFERNLVSTDSPYKLNIDVARHDPEYWAEPHSLDAVKASMLKENIVKSYEVYAEIRNGSI